MEIASLEKDCRPVRRDIINLTADAAAEDGKPKCIIAHTVKGKGVSFMENQVGWHGKAPSEEERRQALKELEAES